MSNNREFYTANSRWCSTENAALEYYAPGGTAYRAYVNGVGDGTVVGTLIVEYWLTFKSYNNDLELA